MSQPRKSRKRAKGAIDLMPLIDDVQDSLDRLQVAYEQGFSMPDALADLVAYVGDLEDGIDKNEECK